MLADLLDHDPAESDLAGLSIDTDLRWRIVTALAAAGEIDADGPETPFIDAEVKRDPTAAGKRNGAQAATARPQAAVKEAAWTSGHRGRHVGQHHHPLDHQRFRPARTGRAAAAVRSPVLRARSRGLWERRSSEVAQTVVVGLYPSWDISDDGIAAADEFLGDTGLPPALRRLVLEGRAGVERSLRARKFDSGGAA